MKKKIFKIIKKSYELRKKIIEIVIKNGGHLATSFSCLDILVCLYYGNLIKYKSIQIIKCFNLFNIAILNLI
jgi:deoxyxylulose-5-phosphate synthase